MNITNGAHVEDLFYVKQIKPMQDVELHIRCEMFDTQVEEAVRS